MILVQIKGDLKITDVEAELLGHMLDYKYLKEFYEVCSKKYTPEQLDKGLQGMRTQCAQIRAAQAAAVVGAREALNPPRSTQPTPPPEPLSTTTPATLPATPLATEAK